MVPSEGDKMTDQTPDEHLAAMIVHEEEVGPEHLD